MVTLDRESLCKMATPDKESLQNGHQTQNLYVLATLDREPLCHGYLR